MLGIPPQWTPPPPPPPLPGVALLKERWPGPAGPARPVALGVLVAAAAVAASVLPLDRPGLGWLVVALVATGALVTVAVTAPTHADDRPDGTGVPGPVVRVGWALATIALVSVGVFRAAEWLFLLCLLAALITATLAVTGGRSLLGMLVAGLLPPVAVFRALPWARGGLRTLRTAGGGNLVRILISVGVTVGLLVLFGLLFAAADAIFADLVGAVLPEVSVPGVVTWVLRFLLVGGALLAGAHLLAGPPDLAGLRAPGARPVGRLEWALPLVLLDLLFTGFVLVQLTVLFGGAEHVLTTAGLTYAEYARGGFWQLLAVSLLTLLVLAGAGRWAPRSTRADRVLFRVLLGALTLLSLVVVASALYRMQVYTDAYGATRLRLLVATVELALGVVFLLVGVAVLRLRAGWLPPFVVGTAVLALLGLALVDPDRAIAERNVDRYARTGALDTVYLSRLSLDAVPALDRLPEPARSCTLRFLVDNRYPGEDLWTTNLGRARARKVFATNPVRTTGLSCPLFDGRPTGP
ncbi:DUF4153 domain-containing protein [Micromonospora rosaria]|uniref:DUF4153 domain-containing protein n=1 Tax=Micromonospora rosaria TaxID=47874 RepID=UPI0037C847BE